MMWKSILAGTAALAIAGSTFVYAQQRDGGFRRGEHFGPDRAASRTLSPEDRAAFTDARIAALKAGLRLTPEQEKHWAAFESALREMATLRDARAESRSAGRRDERSERRGEFTSSDRLRQRGERMSKMGEGLQRLADTQEPLYQSLDEAQKNRFGLLARVLTSPRSHFAQLRGRERHQMRSHRGHERDDRRDRGQRRMQRMQVPGDGTTGTPDTERL
jgi:hypothetical protein